MKKLFALILCCVILLSFTACTDSKNTESAIKPTESITETQPQTTAVDYPAKIAKRINVLEFEGIVYVTNKGEVVYSQTNGKDEKGNDLTLDTPMYIGSVSKQFCAAGIMMLSEQGELSVEDTLDKYFPEYEAGKDITIHNLLCMRSGIPDHTQGAAELFDTEKNESENIGAMKEWIFSQPLNFEAGTKMEYSNTNYFLLGNIIEQVTGQHYESFIRENIFEPLKMTNSGFISEVETKAEFSKSLSFDTFTVGENAEGLVKGAGEIVSTAYDMDKWMTALKSGKIVSKESFEEMIKDYSPDFAKKYGYGLEAMYRGVGHTGRIGNYGSVNFMGTKEDYNIYAVGINVDERVCQIPSVVMTVLTEG